MRIMLQQLKRDMLIKFKSKRIKNTYHVIYLRKKENMTKKQGKCENWKVI